MKRTVTVFGLISGGLISLMMSASMLYMKHRSGHSPYGMLIGYGSMLLAFCLIFVAVRNYRDKYLGGTISFGKAFLTGLWITLIASLCYTVTWIIIYKNFYPEFMDQLIQMELDSARRKGPEALAKANEQIAQMRSWYSTYAGIFAATMMEILPVGLLISLISAAVLKRKEPRTVPAPQYS